MYLTQALHRAAQINSDGIATIDGARCRRWGELIQRVERLAAGLRALGIGRGERVAVLALNSDRYFESYFAILWAGAVVVPLNVRWKAREIADCLADCEPKLWIVDSAHVPLADEVCGLLEEPPLRIHGGDGPPPADHASFDELIQSSPAVAAVRRRPDDVAGIFYTGGTTGRSKGVMLSQLNLYSNAVGTIARLGLSERDIYLHAAPMFHLADGLSTWAITLVAGTHVFVPRFDPPQVLAALAAERVSYLTLVPSMLQMLLEQPDFDDFDLSALRRLFYGASPMPERVMRRALDVLPECRFFGAYGMTELSPIATILDPEYHAVSGELAGRLKSVGRATLGVQLRIADAQGRELPRGEVGEIRICGPNVMLGYWNRPEETQAALHEGWLRSGDAGYMDEQGFVYIVDRLKDMIITGGENVYCTEVEAALYRHPDVAQCAVFAIPDERWGEAVHAVVVPRPGARCDAAALIAHCRAELAGYKCPQGIEFRSEPLPLSGAGKVLKTELRAPYWRGRDRQIG